MTLVAPEPVAAAGDQLAGLGGLDLTALCGDAQAGGRRLRGVIDARGLCGADDQPTTAQLAYIAARAVGLAQGLAERAHPDPRPRLWIVNAAQSHRPQPSSGALSGAPLAGLARTIANELPELGCGLVSVADPTSERDLDAVADALRGADPPAEVNVHGGRAHAPTLVTVSERPGTRLEARSDRTYLVTGGLGALGQHVARRLVDRGARHLVLLGRRAPTPGETRGITALLGEADVRFVQADISDNSDLRAALMFLEAGDTPLGGVFHAAGVLEDALVENIDEPALARALAGKAAGAWNLHCLTRDQPIEMFVLFSSLAGLVGSPGQAAYGAANAFLDALAQHRAALGLPALSIDWGPWAGSGLAVASGGAARLAARGVPPLKPAVGLALLDDALATQRPQITAAAFDLPELADAPLGPVARQLLRALLASEGLHGHSARGAARECLLAVPSSGERLRAVRRFVADEVAAVLRVAPSAVDSTIPFEALGFDSLMAIELRDRMESALELRLSATLVYAHPTPEALAGALAERLESAGGLSAADAAVDDEPGAADAEADGRPEELEAMDEDTLSDLVAAELELLGGGGSL